jgi:pimeloyl-ACP methyl ester carboxylesterase
MAQELLAYDDRGSGRPVVLIHGLTFSRHSWDPIAAGLAERHRVIAFDLPGYGESSGSPADPRVVSERIVATLQKLGVERPVAVGHSAGALQATALAASCPCSGVVNVDQPLFIAPFVEFAQQVAPGLRGDDFAAAFAPFEQSIGVANLPEPERGRLAATRTIEQSLVLEHWWLPLNHSPQDAQAQIEELLREVTVPYLYLAGEEPPKALREYMEGQLEQLEIVVWPNSGHLPHHADIDGFVKLVSDFVARTS